jgi:hypothetical protein
MDKESPEYVAFAALLKRVLSVPPDEVKARLAKPEKKAEGKPKRGPKRKRALEPNQTESKAFRRIRLIRQQNSVPEIANCLWIQTDPLAEIEVIKTHQSSWVFIRSTT